MRHGKYKTYLPLLGRVLMAAAFLLFGYTKLFAFGPAAAGTALVAIAVEALGGSFMLVGFKTRWVAAVLAIWCLVTSFGVHLPIGDPANMSDFYKNLAMAGGFLYVVAYGPGSMSIDASMGTDNA
jgi:putative oxidoreductase